MSERYRKYGRSVRYEHGAYVRAEEAGEAVEDGHTFVCRPVTRDVELPAIDPHGVEQAVSAIRSIVAAPLSIERLVVSEGIAEHRFGDRIWRETSRRVHLSMTYRSVRALVDAGDFELDDVRAIAEMLPRCGSERDVPSRIRLAPNVAAALLPSLIGIAPPNVRLSQTAGGVDGKGQPVEECDAAVRELPNWWRPSYRNRPVRAPFNLRAACDVTAVGEDLPRAIALLAPPAALLLRVLCVHRNEVFPATARVSRIDAIAGESRWYPYGAGSFGAEMMI